jgi:hypothetical protein
MPNTKDKAKDRDVPEHAETLSLDEQILDVASGDDTQRVRTLTVQELERLLKAEKRKP